jgi:uncharacterized membrane protein YeaQ/YmgE (transglycosylase-associated protein family)
MSRFLGLAILSIATMGFATAADLILPRRPPGGFRGLIVVGLVGGLIIGWIADAVGFSFGPSPGGISLVISVLGSVMTIAMVCLYATIFDNPQI